MRKPTVLMDYEWIYGVNCSAAGSEWWGPQCRWLCLLWKCQIPVTVSARRKQRLIWNSRDRHTIHNILISLTHCERPGCGHVPGTIGEYWFLKKENKDNWTCNFTSDVYIGVWGKNDYKSHPTQCCEALCRAPHIPTRLWMILLQPLMSGSHIRLPLQNDGLRPQLHAGQTGVPDTP